MKSVLISVFLLTFATRAHAICKPKYDFVTGSSYQVCTTQSGATTVRGRKSDDRAMWSQHDEKREDALDSIDSIWQYDSETKTYVNQRTGKVCTGEGFSRVCTSGRRS